MTVDTDMDDIFLDVVIVENVEARNRVAHCIKGQIQQSDLVFDDTIITIKHEGYTCFDFKFRPYGAKIERYLSPRSTIFFRCGDRSL